MSKKEPTKSLTRKCTLLAGVACAFSAVADWHQGGIFYGVSVIMVLLMLGSIDGALSD